MTLDGAENLSQVLTLRRESDRASVLVTFTEGESHTAAELWDMAARVSGALEALGCGRGDRIAIICGNRVEFLSAFFGATFGAYVPVPLNTALHGDMLTYVLQDSAPSIVICEVPYLDAARRAVRDAGLAAQILAVGAGADLLPAECHDFATLVDGPPGREPVQASPHDLAAILYTSGTTGPSKGVMLTQRMALGFSNSIDWVLAHEPSDVLYSTLPLFHANALLLTFVGGTRCGGRIVFAPRFSASSFWQDVSEAKATLVYLLGSMTPILWNRAPGPAEQSHRVRTAFVVPAPANLADFEARFGLRVTEAFGLTDAGVPIGVPHGTDRPRGSCGRAQPAWECRVVDEFDDELPPNAVGELVVRPRVPYLSQLGYWNRPDATVSAWRNFWFHTGDLFRVDEEGWFFFVDRAKERIRRSGENVSGFEVEQILIQHPMIAEAAVYAVPSDLAEDEIMAALVVEDGVPPAWDDLLDYCRLRMPYFAVPRYFEVLPELPRTETAKVRKLELSKRGVTGATFDAGPVRRPR